MAYAYLLTAVLLQSPPSAAPAPAPEAAAVPPAAPVPEEARLAAYLEGERRYAERLSGATGIDLRRAFGRYVDRENDKAEERLKGEHDPDDAVQPFVVALENRYRSRVKLGITLFAVGFAPLGVGLYTGLTLGEGSGVMLGLAGVGAAVIGSGITVWAVHGVRLRRIRHARARLEAPRVQWQGLAPLYDPRSRTHGLRLGFAF